jgi:hypothetical protein
VSAALLAAVAVARTVEPNGSVVPIVNTQEEQSTISIYGKHSTLDLLFSSRGESIDSEADARTTPSAFAPRCNFTGALVLHSAGCQMDFGWYNVDPADTKPPADDQIFVLVPRDANASFFPLVGETGLSTFSSDDILSDPRYRGGLIAFAIKNSRQPICSETHYSEQRLNALCDDGSGHCPSATGPLPARHWIMSVSYQSTLSSNAYYLAFEDQPAERLDGDFNDDVYFITGLTCKGGGTACDTGQPGVCSAGLQQCAKTGELACAPTTAPSVEVCDGLDNDCDGVVDNGAALCPAGQICVGGGCVATCTAASCAGGQVCTLSGLCGDDACQTVTCPDGKRCKAGTCVAPCDGVTCPMGQVCRAGACADACLGIKCDGGFVCVAGRCQPGCDCLACPTGTTCGADGRCVSAACVNVTCAAGTTCVGGTCVDDCTGAVCPAGQTCQAGRCVDACGSTNCTSAQKCVAGACVDRCAGVTCAAGQQCQGGACVDSCSLTCGADMVCRSGACVDPCASVTCPAGQACKAGTCRDACGGVMCPDMQKCVAGACVDACQGVLCPSGESCVNGGCHAGCAGTTCPAGQTCMKDLCVDSCEVLTCAAGMSCSAGACVDACTLKKCVGACTNGECVDPCATIACPHGQQCSLGVCMKGPDLVDSDGGADGGGSNAKKSGCGCALGESGSPRAPLWVVLAAAALSRARRRRSRTPSGTVERRRAR